MLTTMILVILCSTTEGNSMRGVSSPATALHIARPFSTTSAYTSSSAIFAGMKGGKNADCLHILDSDLSRNTHDTCSRWTVVTRECQSHVYDTLGALVHQKHYQTNQRQLHRHEARKKINLTDVRNQKRRVTDPGSFLPMGGRQRA